MSTYEEYDKKTLKKIQKTEVEMLKDINKICEKYNLRYFVLDGTGIGAVRHKGFIPWDDDIDIRMTEDTAKKLRKYIEKEMSDKYYFMDINDENYPLSFPKMCKKNTIFMDKTAAQVNCKMGIFIDFFPMVYVSDDKKTREKKLKKSWYIYKLGVLSLLKKPEYNYKGIKGKIMKFIFLITHYLLNIFGFSYKKLYNKGEKIAKENGKTNTLASLNTVKILTSIYDVDDIFPVKKMPFEDTYVYVPKNYDKLLTMSFGDYMKMPPEDKRHNHYPEKLVFDIEKKQGKKE